MIATRAHRNHIQIALHWILLAALSLLGLQAATKGPPEYEEYDSLLRQYVDSNGLVDYAGLKAHPSKLNEFLRELAMIPPQDYESWSRRDRIALWINAYNACTLKAIIDHYPIQSSFLRSLVYPKNSIRQISGVWDSLQFTLVRRKLTLDQIEHEILRQQFGDPRIHVALVCAALSCPPLRNEAYEGTRLDAQFRDQTEKFVSRLENFHFQGDDLYLSKIFDWFGDDFTARYGQAGRIGEHGARESAVLHFLLPHLDPADQQRVRSGNFKIRYSDYNWELNEQPAR